MIYGTAIFSRIPDLAVVDLLYMGIIQSDYERFSAAWTRAVRSSPTGAIRRSEDLRRGLFL